MRSSALSVSASAFVALLALAPLSSGCASPAADDVGDGQQNATANEVNDQQHGLRQLLEHVRPGRAAERAGIARWDVFAGRATAAGSGFEGAVFYASDDEGQAKYFFAFDNASRQYAFGQLDRAGRSVTAPVDRATVDALFADIAMLRSEARRAAAYDCAGAAAVVAFGGVLAAGAAIYTGVPATIATAATAGMAQSATLNTIMSVVLAYVGVQGGIAAVVGTVSAAVVGAVTDTGERCGLAVGGVGGDTSDAPRP